MTKYQFVIPVFFLIIGFVFQPYFPWYGVLFIAALCAFLSRSKPSKSFVLYLILGALLWMIVAYRADVTSSSRLSSKIGTLFGNLNVFTLIGITGLIGGVSSGLGALIGSMSRSLLDKK